MTILKFGHLQVDQQPGFIELLVNSVDPDQTAPEEQSDQDLYCLFCHCCPNFESKYVTGLYRAGLGRLDNHQSLITLQVYLNLIQVNDNFSYLLHFTRLSILEIAIAHQFVSDIVVC